MNWRIVFAVAAVFNIVIGAGYTFAPARMLAAAGMAATPPELGWRLLGWCVITFGIGYALVAMRPAAGTDLVRIGVIGKLGVFSAVTLLWLTGQASGMMMAGGSADLLWTIAFLYFLWRGPVAATLPKAV